MPDPSAPPVSEQGFQKQLAREILVSQRLRATILTAGFTFGGLFLCGGVLYYKMVLDKAFFPEVIIPIIAGIVAYEFFMRHFLGRRIRQEAPISSWVWYLNAAVEITIITTVLILTRRHFENPVYTLLTPAVLVYFIFINFSTLHLDFGTSLFTGGVAAAEYLTVSLYILGGLPTDAGIDPLLLTPFFYMMKTLLFLVGGVGAAFVARELRQRVMRTFRTLEERNRIEAANRAKSAFLANMSHEIRTPLNAILGYAQVLEKDPALSGQQREAIRTIGTSGNHLLNLINDVLDLSKIEAGREELRPADFDLSDLVQGMATMFRLRCEQKGLSWRAEAREGPMRVRGDENRLRQVLINLLGNAVKFTETGGVTLRVTALPEEHYAFEVRDTGPGIPPEQQEAIFQPFQQEETGLKKGGTGLGLAIAHRYVDLMGGHLTVDSAPGAGTRFHFALRLPPARGEEVEAETPPYSNVARLAPGCAVEALIVDDVAENRDVMTRILQRIGATVRLAENGFQALKELQQGIPDVIFLDIRMPGMSGQETLRRMAEAHGRERLKVVALSASVMAHQRRTYLEAGFDAFIDKPVRMERVYACLAELLGVTYTCEAGPGPAEDAPPPDLSRVVLPEVLYRSLRTAAEGYSVTEFRQRLDEVEALGADGQRVAAHLRRLSQRYDTDAILSALDEIGHA